ncbi:MAG: hypothetical protein ACE5IY_06740 [bacterium]
MVKYLKKSDWGDYWTSDAQVTPGRLVERSFDIVAKVGLHLSCDDRPEGQQLFHFLEKLRHEESPAGVDLNPERR